MEERGTAYTIFAIGRPPGREVCIMSDGLHYMDMFQLIQNVICWCGPSPQMHGTWNGIQLVDTHRWCRCLSGSVDKNAKSFYENRWIEADKGWRHSAPATVTLATLIFDGRDVNWQTLLVDVDGAHGITSIISQRYGSDGLHLSSAEREREVV